MLRTFQMTLVHPYIFSASIWTQVDHYAYRRQFMPSIWSQVPVSCKSLNECSCIIENFHIGSYMSAHVCIIEFIYGNSYTSALVCLNL